MPALRCSPFGVTRLIRFVVDDDAETPYGLPRWIKAVAMLASDLDVIERLKQAVHGLEATIPARRLLTIS
jgi:hypothetical protein